MLSGSGCLMGGTLAGPGVRREGRGWRAGGPAGRGQFEPVDNFGDWYPCVVTRAADEWYERAVSQANTDRRSAADEVVELCRDLIRIDTTNTGELRTSAGERVAAEYV